LLLLFNQFALALGEHLGENVSLSKSRRSITIPLKNYIANFQVHLSGEFQSCHIDPVVCRIHACNNLECIKTAAKKQAGMGIVRQPWANINFLFSEMRMLMAGNVQDANIVWINIGALHILNLNTAERFLAAQRVVDVCQDSWVSNDVPFAALKDH
jgi:hypothetical protein